MSLTTEKRVKQIRQKNSSGGFNESIPIGTNGILVDMLSGLDLEEELRLGNDHYVQIKDVKKQIDGTEKIITEIKEWYFDIPKGNNTIAQMKNHIRFSTFIQIDDNNINMTLYRGDIDNDNILHTKTVSITDATSQDPVDRINEEVDA